MCPGSPGCLGVFVVPAVFWEHGEEGLTPGWAGDFSTLGTFGERLPFPLFVLGAFGELQSFPEQYPKLEGLLLE